MGSQRPYWGVGDCRGHIGVFSNCIGVQVTVEVLWAPVGVLGNRIGVQGPYGAIYALQRLYWGLGTILGYRGPMGPYWVFGSLRCSIGVPGCSAGVLRVPRVPYWGP